MFGRSKEKPPCRRCMIIRMFVLCSLMLLLMGIIGGEKLKYLQMVTPERVAALIWGGGLLMFAMKLMFWRLSENAPAPLESTIQADPAAEEKAGSEKQPAE